MTLTSGSDDLFQSSILLFQSSILLFQSSPLLFQSSILLFQSSPLLFQLLFDKDEVTIMQIFRARSSAKINLSLDILERLPNGFHTLRSLVHPVGLWDEIEFSFGAQERIVFYCDHADLSGHDNLCVRAFTAWREAAGVSLGAVIGLHKTIPHGAGLGGGSGNAAAILRVANTHAPHPLSEAALLEVAAKLGADVPLFLQSSPVLMEGIGERLAPLAALEGWVVIVKPSEGFATADIYQAWDENNLASERATDGLLEVWDASDIEEIATRLGNDLEQAARMVSPLPDLCVKILLASGASGARLSGSGSACFGLFPTREIAESARAQIEEQKAKDVLLEGATTFLAPLCVEGIEFVE